MDLIYAIVLIIVLVILIVVVFKLLNVLMVAPFAMAQDPPVIVEETLDTGPAQITINESNSTQCFKNR